MIGRLQLASTTPSAEKLARRYVRNKNIPVSNCEADEREFVSKLVDLFVNESGNGGDGKKEGMANLSMASWLFESPISAAGSRRKSRRRSL